MGRFFSYTSILRQKVVGCLLTLQYSTAVSMTCFQITSSRRSASLEGSDETFCIESGGGVAVPVSESASMSRVFIPSPSDAAESPCALDAMLIALSLRVSATERRAGLALPTLTTEFDRGTGGPLLGLSRVAAKNRTRNVNSEDALSRRTKSNDRKTASTGCTWRFRNHGSLALFDSKN